MGGIEPPCWKLREGGTTVRIPFTVLPVRLNGKMPGQFPWKVFGQAVQGTAFPDPIVFAT